MVLTTGTEADVPPIPGLADGPFWTNREAIWNPGPPPGSLAVIGTGAIGTEFAQIYARFGSRVTALEVLPHFLPQEDEEAAASLIPALERDGIALLPGVDIERADHDGIPVDPRPSRKRIPCSRTRCWSRRGGVRCSTRTISMRPASSWTARGTRCSATRSGRRTRTSGSPATPPVTSSSPTWGTYEAELVVKDILGHPEDRTTASSRGSRSAIRRWRASASPNGRRATTASTSSPRSSRSEDNERSHIEGEPYGLVKLIAHRGSGELVGGHIVGEVAGTLIHQVVLMMFARTTAPAVARAIPAYPTFSESVKSALLGIDEQVG